MKTVGGLALLVTTGIALASSAHAAPVPKTSTTQHVTTFPMSAKMCAAMKSAHPDKVNDPNLCLLRHTEVISTTDYGAAVTTQRSGTAGSVSPLTCPNKTQSFQDWYDTVTGEWSLQLNTSWRWSGNCAAPALTAENCYPNWLLGWQISASSCTSYTTGIPSRAALYQVTLQGGAFGWISETVWMRRECYGNGSTQFHTDMG